MADWLCPDCAENTLIAEDSCPVCRLTEPQTVRLEHLYDVLYDELTEGNDDGAHHLLLAILTLVQQFRATAAEGSTHSGNAFATAASRTTSTSILRTNFLCSRWRMCCMSVRTIWRISARK